MDPSIHHPSFVVTAVDGSAALWERAAEQMLEAIERHDSVLRAQLPAHGGVEERRGAADGFVLRFEDAVQAVRFCLEAQQALRASKGLALRVGMGVARGPALARRGPVSDRVEHFGPAVSRATALAAAARGGQVLVGKALADELRRDLALRARVLDPGELPDGLDGEEPIVAVLDAPPSEPPPALRAPPRRRETRVSLPREKDVFIGREADLGALYGLFADGARVVTLLGPGGVGKTRLSVHFAHRVAGEYAAAGGVWLADLGEARTLDEILRTVADAIGVTLESGRTAADATQRIGRALEKKSPLLIVLDNFEQIVEQAGATVAKWAELASEARFIVTSRARLGIPGEHCHELRPLSEPEALDLFRARARAAGVALGTDPGELDAVTAIVRRLECLPLAIELAAARSRVLPPRVLSKRLATGFDVLRSSSPTPRHGTLRETVRWSWDLLGNDGREALAQCAVFRGGFGLEAAEAVLLLEGTPILDALDGLADKSLVRAVDVPALGDEVRFDLYSTIREFALERLDATGRRRATELRHATYYVEAGERWLEAVRATDDTTARARLEADVGNLVAAFQRSLERAPATAVRAALILDGVSEARESLEAHARLLDQAVAAAERTGEAPLLVMARLARARCQYARGIFRDARADVAAAASLAREQGLHALEGEAESLQGLVLRAAMRVVESREAYERALAALERSGDRRQLGVLLGRLAVHDHGEGRLDEAEARFERALALHAEAGNRTLEAMDQANYALLEHERGKHDRARELYERSLASIRAAKNRRLEGITLVYVTALEHDDGRLDRARALAQDALAILREAGDRRFEGLARLELGFIAYERGELHEAEARFAETQAHGAESGDTMIEVFAQISLALLHATLGRRDQARAAIFSARAKVAAQGSPWMPANVDALATVLGLYTPDEIPVAPPAATPPQDVPPPSVPPPAAGGARGSERPPAPATISPRLTEVRFGLRLLKRALGQREARARELGVGLAQAETSLEVGPGGKWFRPPGGQRVDLARREALARILDRLVAERRAAPDRPIDVAETCAAGWPGEALAPKAAANRVRVAVSTLRTLGLRSVLLTRGDGYLLDPAVELV